MKVMEHVPDEHLLFFFCFDYTIWPGKPPQVFITSGQKVIVVDLPSVMLRPAIHQDKHSKLQTYKDEANLR